jgi:alpha-mannosidase
MGFFKPWYDALEQENKDKVKAVIKNGQLEIVGGGWSGNDEANPNFEDIINNFMIGHEFLKKEFGVVPTIGWNIDDFGHSDTNTRIFGQMGYEAMFFSRLHHNDKE